MGTSTPKCYVCGWTLTKNGTDSRRRLKGRVQRYKCRDNCPVGNIFIITECDDDPTLVGMYYYPKIYDRVFTYEETQEMYHQKEKHLSSYKSEQTLKTVGGKKELIKFIIDQEGVEDNIRAKKQLKNRKKLIEAALERNHIKVAKLKAELEDIEDELDLIRSLKTPIRTRADAKAYVEKMSDYTGRKITT